MTRKKMVPEIIGIVTRVVCCQKFAPSTRADSYNSCGTLRSAANRMMTDDPTVHKLIKIMPGFTQLGSVVQLGPEIPNSDKNLLMTPSWPLNNSNNMIPTATGGVIFGRKNAGRQNPAARPARFSSSASDSAIVISNGT